MPTITEAIKNFLTSVPHNGPDLIARYIERCAQMETQINVVTTKGRRVEEKRGVWTDGLNEWRNMRIPRNAATKPEFHDSEMPFRLSEYAEAIGSTGWDWVNRRSRWFGFDFDSIAGHAAGVGISEEQLERVREAAKALNVVEVRRSTGGKGLHLYVFTDGIETANHTEHAALARAVLGILGSAAGFDFARHIDACGGNMWLWHRKMSEQNQGLSLVKPAERLLTMDDLPSNWRDHIEVVTRKRAKVRVEGVQNSEEKFDALASSQKAIPLDETHQGVIEALKSEGVSVIWVPDYHLLQTHTVGLQRVMENCRKDLNLIGFFKTNSRGNDLGEPNCFMFPLENGGWKVYRFSPGTAESQTWEQDGQGWTTCYFNRKPSLKVACRALGGVEDPEKREFIFERAALAVETAEIFGQEIELPDGMQDREARVSVSRDGRLIVKVVKREGDEGMKAEGWVAKKDFWIQVFETRTDSMEEAFDYADLDRKVRALTTPGKDRAGWVVRQINGDWNRVPKDEAKNVLLAHGISKAEADIMLGHAAQNSWRMVNMPFQPEYPGDRQWNYDAAQYAYAPAVLSDDETPHHPHWDMILRHCGQDLDEPLRQAEWAQESNIRTGGEYLQYWLACMLREPYEKLPYLFMYGEQESGKSIFHEAASLLMTRGAAAADRPLKNQNDFNGELMNCVLAYVEEVDISKTPGAYNKLKDWVTSPVIWIRKMRMDAFPQVNTLHFVHTANERDAISIKMGDTRITFIFVPALPPNTEIPKSILRENLKAEAPHFMRTLMDLQLPPLRGRLRLPVIHTRNKERAMEESQNLLETFISSHCNYEENAEILFAEFYDAFHSWLEAEQAGSKSEWSGRQKVSRALPDKHVVRVGGKGKRYIQNISWKQDVK